MSERRATIRTDHGDAETATRLARALAPDNTEEMATTTDGATVETTIERATTGGLAATVDDYVVNLSVAEQLVTDRHTDTNE
jgi:flagellar basal body P-ring protein FlgI